MFKKLAVMFFVALAGPVLLTGCASEAEPVADELAVWDGSEQVGTEESELATCGTGLICSLSPVSGSTYCQSGSQQVYCCGLGQMICGSSCVAKCEWRDRQSGTSSSCTRWKEEFCRDSSCTFRSTGVKCCYTTTPTAC
jgi:hypothetical protein